MYASLSQRLVCSGMLVVFAYHAICGNVFLNTSFEEATGLEKVGNLFLAPTQYLLAGKNILRINETYQIQQRFDYEENWALCTGASLLTFLATLPIGCLLKGIDYLCCEATAARHRQLVAFLKSEKIDSKVDYYRSLGLRIGEVCAPYLESPPFQRRKGEENHLFLEKELLSQVVTIFKNHQIPFWVDCGTCLGAYRYGGVIPWDRDIDLAVLAPDFDNVIHALNALDEKKYQIQDWSNRSRPKTYIRVYLRENGNHLDIYHFKLHPETQQLSSILSNEESVFLPESWKILERRFTCRSDYETIFPLRKGTFDGIEVYLPHHTKKYLQERYGENIDPVKIYNEISGKYEKNLEHPYWQLPYAY